MVNKADYNNENVTLAVTPVELFELGKRIESISVTIADHFLAIHNEWKALALGWSGRSQEESDAFAKDHKLAMDDFFGEEGADTDPEKKQGVVNRVAGGVQGAGDAYAQSEVSLFYGFKWFADSLEFPDQELNTSIREHAHVEPPAEGPEPKVGERDFTSPPVSEKTSGAPTPWFEEGAEVQGTWTWIEPAEGPQDKRITVEDGAIWTGREGDGVTVEWVDDEE
ncbi:hypothetical protein ACN27G_19405 [Plantactinospora sp. WMMB334]|uniref:hypothetical protein n=1 Tax=Plantactinospora sp. WMMB334 TaxID=3404119 RepID=UPI003B947E77